MKCEILKRIRCSIAELNEIKYEPKPCDHKEDCLGTCPRCDKEAELLMEELRRKEAAGIPIRIDTESLDAFESLAISDIVDDDEDIQQIGEIKGDIFPDDFTPGYVLPPDKLEEREETT